MKFALLAKSFARNGRTDWSVGMASLWYFAYIQEFVFVLSFSLNITNLIVRVCQSLKSHSASCYVPTERTYWRTNWIVDVALTKYWFQGNALSVERNVSQPPSFHCKTCEHWTLRMSYKLKKVDINSTFLYLYLTNTINWLLFMINFENIYFSIFFFYSLELFYPFK